ncbi:MAG: ATP-binding protein [Marinobacterium sp.]|nr:ATP-binding protein [Marinobacterium sp.]
MSANDNDLARELAIYQRALQREKQARLDAEQLLENSTRQLYQQNQTLQQQQAAMLQNEKLATIGMLSAGIAHEINNPLAVVLSNLNALTDYTEQLLTLLEQVQQWQQQGTLNASAAERFTQLDSQADFAFLAEDAPDMMEDMREGLIRVQDIVSNLKTFSRTRPGERQQVDINQCIQTSLRLVNNTIKDHCSVVTDLPPLPEVAVNNSELSQVFMNLIINAAHATEDQHGQIQLRTRQQADCLVIEVEDNGCGIPENLCKDIFNPFFTTKPPGKGTGMGLSVAHSIISNHGGTLTVNSTPGLGSCFTICLPLDMKQPLSVTEHPIKP